MVSPSPTTVSFQCCFKHINLLRLPLTPTFLLSGCFYPDDPSSPHQTPAAGGSGYALPRKGCPPPGHCPPRSLLPPPRRARARRRGGAVRGAEPRGPPAPPPPPEPRARSTPRLIARTSHRHQVSPLARASQQICLCILSIGTALQYKGVWRSRITKIKTKTHQGHYPVPRFGLSAAPALVLFIASPRINPGVHSWQGQGCAAGSPRGKRTATQSMA